MSRQIIFIVVLIAVAFGGYYYWKQSSGTEVVQTTAGPTPFAKEINQKLEQYRRINSLAPNLSIFEDTLFRELRPSGAGSVSSGTSTAVNRGRSNPFVSF